MHFQRYRGFLICGVDIGVIFIKTIMVSLINLVRRFWFPIYGDYEGGGISYKEERLVTTIKFILFKFSIGGIKSFFPDINILIVCYGDILY